MSKKTFVVIFIIIILAALGFYFYKYRQAKAPAEQSQTLQQQASSSPTLAAPALPIVANGPTGSSTSVKNQSGHFSSGEGADNGGGIQVWEVDYDGTKFTPASITIQAGDYIFFENKSTVSFWPAPVSSGQSYPGFGSAQSIPAGGEYKFQFSKAETWSYGDKLNSQATGTVIVQ